MRYVFSGRDWTISEDVSTKTFLILTGEIDWSDLMKQGCEEQQYRLHDLYSEMLLRQILCGPEHAPGLEAINLVEGVIQQITFCYRGIEQVVVL